MTNPRLFAALAHLALCSAILPALASSTTRYVWLNSPNPGPPYATWATAAHTLQDAVDVALDGDTVLATNGIYSAGGRAVVGIMTNRVAIGRAITLQSVHGPQVTLIEGAGAPGGRNGDGAIRCVYLSSNAILSGFTLRNGHTRARPASDEEMYGGAVWGERTGLVTNCWLVGNSAEYGGGAAYAVLVNCTLTQNRARTGGGAGVCELHGSLVAGNVAEESGGGTDECSLYDCVLTNNVALTGDGGGADSGEVFYRCWIIDNQADDDGGGVDGGQLVNCVLMGNRAGAGGGASRAALIHCTVVSNACFNRNAAGGVWDCEVTNSIVYHNENWGGSPGPPNHFLSMLEYACTYPLPSDGVGNITNEPSFLNPDAGDYRLAPGSACIDAGTNLTGIVTNDLDGKPRPIDGNADGITAFDMGAYEHGVVLEISPVPPGDQVTLSWVASPGETYALEETPTLAPPAWTLSPSGSMNPVTVNVSVQEKYWRLWQVPSNTVWVAMFKEQGLLVTIPEQPCAVIITYQSVVRTGSGERP